MKFSHHRSGEAQGLWAFVMIKSIKMDTWRKSFKTGETVQIFLILLHVTANTGQDKHSGTSLRICSAVTHS